MRVLTFLTIVAVATVGFAQELVPELAGPAGKYKAAAEALEKQRLEAVAVASKSYVGLLDGIEKSATAKGDVNLVAAVVKEREAVVAGTLETDFPAALPKAKLQGTRKAALMKTGQIAVDFAKRRKQMDAGYLQALATLQAKAALDSDLAKQVAAEKAALLAGTTAGSGGVEKTKASRGKNVVVNGDFEKIGADGKPDGWNNTHYCTVESEDKNTFIRFTGKSANADGTIDIAHIYQNAETPLNAKTMTISTKCRARGTKGRAGAAFPATQVEFLDQQGKTLLCIQAPLNEMNSSWKVISTKASVPKETVGCKIQIENNRYSGQVDFDDVEVTFK